MSVSKDKIEIDGQSVEFPSRIDGKISIDPKKFGACKHHHPVTFPFDTTDVNALLREIERLRKENDGIVMEYGDKIAQLDDIARQTTSVEVLEKIAEVKAELSKIGQIHTTVDSIEGIVQNNNIAISKVSSRVITTENNTNDIKIGLAETKDAAIAAKNAAENIHVDIPENIAKTSDLNRVVERVASSLLLKTKHSDDVNRIIIEPNRQGWPYIDADYLYFDHERNLFVFIDPQGRTKDDDELLYLVTPNRGEVTEGCDVYRESLEDGVIDFYGHVGSVENFRIPSVKDLARITIESEEGAIEKAVNNIKESVGEDTTPMPLNIMGDEEPRPKMSLHDKMYMLAGMIGTKGDSQTGEESIYAEIEKNGNKLSALTNSNVLSNTPSVVIISGMAYSFVGVGELTIEEHTVPAYKWHIIMTPQVITAELPEEYHMLYSVNAAEGSQLYTIEDGEAVALDGVVIEECRSLGGVEKKVSDLATKVGKSPEGKTLFEAIAAGGGGGGGDSKYSKWTAEQLGYDGTPTEYEVISQDEVDTSINEAWSTTFGKADPQVVGSKDFEYICELTKALLDGDIQQSAQDAVEELMERLNQ